jgi:hypothetical protein
MSRLLLLCIIATGLAAPSMAQDDAPISRSHATFVDGDKSIENLIKFPRHEGDAEVTVSCTGHATAKGRLRDIRCSAADDPDLKFSNAVKRRSAATRLVPAMIDGKAEEVDIQFSVTFEKQGETKLIRHQLNNGNNVDRLGTDYLSAQRYSPHSFPSVCNDRAFTNQGAAKIMIEVAIIDVNGNARGAQVTSSNWRIPGPCESALVAQIENGAWIPARHDGTFVESIWASPIVVARTDGSRGSGDVEF